MTSHLKKISVAIALTLASGVAMAESAPSPTGDSSIAKDQLVISEIERKIHSGSPSLKSYKVTLDSTSEEFKAKISDDFLPIMFTGKRFLVDKKGEVLIDPASSFNIGKNSIEPLSASLMSLDLETEEFSDNYISHKLPEGVDKKGDVFVLTDPTCGYCHKIEQEMDTYLDNGLQVHLIPYPRSGVADINQAAMSRWASAACSDEPAIAYRKISLGDLETYPVVNDINAECVDVVKKGYAYGKKIGISGTPFMYGVSNDGEKVSQPGYVPVRDFASKLGVFIKQDSASKLLN